MPALLAANAEKWGDQRLAFRKKHFGLWRTFTWNDYLELVKEFALGLTRLGLKKGDKAAIIGDNAPEWIIAELAVQSLGAVPTGAFTDSTPEELQYMIDRTEACLVVARDQEQIDKVLAIREKCPRLKAAVYWDPQGMRNYDPEFYLSFDQVRAWGREIDRDQPDLFRKTMSEAGPDDTALLLFTSGTGGRPKAAAHTYRTLLAVAEGWLQVHRHDVLDNYVSFAPLAWIPEQLFGVIFPLCSGSIVNFAEKAESVQIDTKEISPSIIAMSPRLWEDLSSTVLSRMADANFLRQTPYKFFLSLGYRIADLEFAKEESPIYLKLLARLGEWLVYRPLRDNLGLRKIRHAYSGGADLGADTFRFYKAVGVNIKQLYGCTESGGISTTHSDEDVKFSTVGRPLAGCQVKISEVGEILIKGPGVFKGYYQDPEATGKAFTDEGWLMTGDAGFLDEDGHLVCIGRLSDLMTLPDGTKFSPVLIETKMKFSPYIKDAVVFGGGGRPYITSIIVVDYETVSQWAEKRGIAFTTYTDLSQKPEIYDLIEEHLQWVNRGLPDSAKVKRFSNLYKELDPDEAELTRSRKLRRSFFIEKYPALVDCLYGREESVAVDGEVKYRDGRVGRIKTVIRVKKVEG